MRNLALAAVIFLGGMGFSPALAQSAPLSDRIETPKTTTTTMVQNPEHGCLPSQSGPAVSGSLDCNESIEVQIGSLTPSSEGGRVVFLSSSGKKYLSYNRVVGLPNGGFCTAVGYYDAAEGLPADRLSDAPGNHAGTEFNNFYEIPSCPEQPSTSGQTAPVDTPAALAARYWERVPLPSPVPRIAPGRAITGKLAFLETGGEVSATYDNDTFFGPLHITATGTYMVDWGDGTTTGPYSYAGKAWPDGEITHEYIRVGSYNIVVTERWTAYWSLYGQSGTLRTLQTTGRIDNFPVEQIQAVIGR